ncbi:MAG: PQQ-binding-like beta-propeller repeat protein, partial [Planctomycetaceae bacterium]
MLALVWSGSLSVGIGDGTAEEPRSSGVIPGSYSGSAANLQDRAAEQLLRDAQRDFDSGDTVSGVRRLQELFNRGRESFLLIDGVYRPADDAAAVLLQRGPPLHRETYERLFGPVARQDLDQALSVDDRADIHRVARKFRFTAAGSRAGLALAVRAWDRGDRDLAAEWWRHVNEWNARDVAPERSGSVYAQIAQFVRDAVNGDTGRDAPGTSFPQVRVELTAARWRRDVPMTDAARQEIAVSLAELDAQAILPLMPARPLIRGGVAYWRPLESIAAVNLQTGDVLWEYAVPTHVSSLIREDRDFENSIRRSSSTAVFLERLVRSSLVDQLSTDGTHLFAVIANPSPRQIPAGDPNAPPPPPPKNELVALSLQDGRPLWRTGPADGWGARKQAAEPAAENDSAETDMTRIDPGAALEDVFFMGPPQPFGHWRIVIGQKDRTVFVLALDARNGKLGWSVPLGRVAQGLWDDKPRHGTACPVTIHNGRAYCPTACGCFACVDLVTRRLLWAFRYPRDDLARSALSPERFRPDTTHASNLPTREQWHEVFVHIGKGEGGGGGGGTVVFSSPDTGRMFGLEARTGRVQWSRPRERGLFAVGLDDERVLVVAADEAIARSISDGKTLWRTGISRPSGTGFLTGTEYVFPTEAGGLQRVGRVDGATQLDFARGDDLPRAEVGGRHVAISVGPPPRLRPVSMHNLVAADGMVLVQSFDRLTAVPLGNLENSEEPVQSPDVARDNQTADPEHFPGWSWPVDEDRLGEWTSALRVARFASPSFGAVQSALSTARQLQPLMRASNDRAAELLEELAETFHGGDGAPEDSAPADAILRRLMRQPLDELYVRLDNPRRSVRLDRWLESG